MQVEYLWGGCTALRKALNKDTALTEIRIAYRIYKILLRIFDEPHTTVKSK